MTVHSDKTVLPPPLGADSQLHKLIAVLASGAELSLTAEDGQEFALTSELRTVLTHAANALSEGQAVTLEPRRTRLSTQEAAELLGVSRPTVVKLLESGAIAFTKPGRHRRVQLEDLLHYQRQLRESRRIELDAMSNEAAEDDGYHRYNGFTTTR